jgi:hypothetical protein
MMTRFAACFHDERRADLIEHEVVTLVGQRVFAIALGYEDLNDHDNLRHDPMMAVLAGKLEARREDCAPVAGKSTLNRLELSNLEPTRYHKISHNPIAIKRLLVDLFLETQERAPNEIILDLDATDDPVHGSQEGRFFHGHYDCYCYLPLYIFCGRHLLAAKLRRASVDAADGAVEEVARIVGQIRRRWPEVRILLRADSGFARDELMAWCEANAVHFVFGLAKNDRLIAAIKDELAAAEKTSRRTGKPARRFKQFKWTTRKSWSRERRVVAKAEWTQGEANPRFIVTSLKRAECKPRYLYEKVYCARGDMENRIKECQLDLYADRTSTATMRAKPAAAMVLFDGLRAAVRLASHWPGANQLCQSNLRHHSPQAPKDRCAGAHQRSPHQNCHGLGLPGSDHLGTCRLSPRGRGQRSRFARLTRAAARVTHAASSEGPREPLFFRCTRSSSTIPKKPRLPTPPRNSFAKHQQTASQIPAQLPR